MDAGIDSVRIVDIVDAATFELVPPCADPSFDHRSCDYWEDAQRGSKAPRRSSIPPRPTAPAPSLAGNPFAPPTSGSSFNPFLADLDERDQAGNPFLPGRPSSPPAPGDAARVGGSGKLALLTRGQGVFGSYAKVLLVGEAACAYAQFGPLSAYPRALHLRELYPALPSAPLPAVITCIATTRTGRDRGLGRRLVEEVCRDLARRGFSAVETYPEIGALPESTSTATPEFWSAVGFARAIADDRFPVFRRELD